VNRERILQLAPLLAEGRIYYNPERERIEANLPTGAPSNHAPSLLELDNGDLLCVWFGGSDEGSGDISILMSRLPEGGGAWTAPVTLTHDDTKADQNPSLFQAPNGDLWLVHTSMDTRGCTLEEWQRRLAAGEAEGPYAMQHTSRIRCRVSKDRGHSWGEPFTLFDREGSFCRHPIQVLSNGDWIFAVWYSFLDGRSAFGSDYSAVMISSDEGRTWKEHAVPGSAGRVHMSIVEQDPGQLIAFFRSRAADRIYVSRSDDFGRTWTEPVRTELPNNNASIRAMKLRSGKLAVVYNDVSVNDDPHRTIWPYERYPVTIALSEDGGETWPYRRHIEAGDGYCGSANRNGNRRYEYPFILQTKDGLIHAVYAYRTRVWIKHAAFTEDWIVGNGENGWPWSNFPVS